jgi:ribonuclease HII
MEKRYIVGIDEVGRGPVAGPVMVGAFIFLSPDFEKQIKEYSTENKLPLRDSKKLAKKQKEKWVKYFKQEKEKGNCDFAMSAVSASDIDKIGIVPSIQKALNNSLARVTTQVIERATQDIPNFSAFTLKGSDADKNLEHLASPHIFNSSQEVSSASFHVYLDGGLKAPIEYVNQQTIIKGDELHPVISCASIVAKVTRDRLMDKYSLEYPEYGFENHAGYGTSAHYEAIKNNGLTPVHRKTFLKNIK